MGTKSLERNLILYYWYQFLVEPVFWGAILVTFMKTAGQMTTTQVYTMEAVVLAIVMIAQIPTGALADTIGRKKTLIVGSSLFFIGGVIFAAANSIYLMWISDIIIMIGVSLICGADNALLYDTLIHLKRQNEYKRIVGKAYCYRFIFAAICSISVGYLAKISLRLPIVLGCIPTLLSIVIAFRFIEAPIQIKNHSMFENIVGK